MKNRTPAIALTLILAFFGLLSACGRGVPQGANIVVAGDSVMAWNRGAGSGVADQLAAQLGVPVGDLSLPLARVTNASGPLSIASQVRNQSTDWVVLNGGANDLRGDCGCNDCDAVLDQLIAADGRSGAIPQMVAGLRNRGARVIWADYYTSPRYAGTTCTAPYTELNSRLTRMAMADTGVTLVDMGDVISPTDAAMFDKDRLHPSPAGSARIATLIAPELR